MYYFLLKSIFLGKTLRQNPSARPFGETLRDMQSFFYYYKIDANGRKKYFSVDGKPKRISDFQKSDLEKINAYSDEWDYIDALERSKNAEMIEISLREKIELYKKVMDTFGGKEFMKSIESKYDDIVPEFFYMKKKIPPNKKITSFVSVYDYRYYTSKHDLIVLANLGVIKGAQREVHKKIYPRFVDADNSTSSAEIYLLVGEKRIALGKIEDLPLFHDETAEKYSRINILRKYSTKMDKLVENMLLLEKKLVKLRFKVEEIIMRSPKLINLSDADILKIKKDREELIRRYIESLRGGGGKKEELPQNIPAPTVLTGNALLVSLGVKDKASFRVWMKANHPDKHQSSSELANINALFARALDAAKMVGYI